MPQKPKKHPIEVADIDDIFSFGKKIGISKEDGGVFVGVVVEQWEYNGIAYEIERTGDNPALPWGDSAVIAAEDIKDANFCAEIYRSEVLCKLDCFKDKKTATAWAKSKAKDGEHWRVRNRRTEKIVASLTSAIWRWDD